MTHRISRRSVTRPADRIGRRSARPAPVTAGVLAVALLLGACSGGSTDAATGDGTDSGYSSQDGTFTSWPEGSRKGPVRITGTDYSGTAQDTSDWLGDVVVINTWYAACPPCREEAADLVAVAEDYVDQGVHVLGINGVDDAGAAESFQRTFEVPYPSIDDRDKAAVAALQGVVPVQATPTTVVLDREGRVFARVVGMVEGSTLRALVEQALAEGGAASSGAATDRATATDGA